MIVDPTGIVDPNGISGEFKFQWQSSRDGVTWADEPVEIFRNFIPRQRHVGRYIRVVVSYIDDSGNLEVIEGPPSEPVRSVSSKPTGSEDKSEFTPEADFASAISLISDGSFGEAAKKKIRDF